MSQQLESLLGADRRAECAKNDEGPREAKPLPTRAQVTDDWHRRNDARAMALDQQHFDVLRRTGVL
jgi:hypothetical protein